MHKDVWGGILLGRDFRVTMIYAGVELELKRNHVMIGAVVALLLLIII